MLLRGVESPHQVLVTFAESIPGRDVASPWAGLACMPFEMSSCEYSSSGTRDPIYTDHGTEISFGQKGRRMFGASFLNVALIIWAVVTAGFIGVMIIKSLTSMREDDVVILNPAEAKRACASRKLGSG